MFSLFRFLAKAFERLQLNQSRLVFRPAEVSLDRDEILEPYHPQLDTSGVEQLGARYKRLVVSKRLQVAQQIQRTLVGIEREVRAKRQAFRIESKGEIGGGTTEGRMEVFQCFGKAADVLFGSPVAKIDIKGCGWSAKKHRRLSAHDHELDAMVSKALSDSNETWLLGACVRIHEERPYPRRASP